MLSIASDPNATRRAEADRRPPGAGVELCSRRTVVPVIRRSKTHEIGARKPRTPRFFGRPAVDAWGANETAPMLDLPNLSRARDRMVNVQIARRGVRDPLVLETMRRVPRETFVEPGCEEFAYEEGPLPIGEGQTISQPYRTAAHFMLLHSTHHKHVCGECAKSVRSAPAIALR